MQANSIPWVPEAEWAARTDPDREPLEALQDAVWRIANLYQIIDRDGRVRPFRPKREQRVIIWDIHVRGIKNLIIPKARKLGMSTVVCVIIADAIAWTSAIECAIVDKTVQDARGKLEMAKFAADSMDRPFRSRLCSPPGYNSKDQFGLKLANVPEELGGETYKPSVVKAGDSFRGGTPQILLVSEWGTIQFEDVKRSEEIKTGAMIAARDGIRIIETTWKGGKGGHVWSYVEDALSTPEADKTEKDWRLRFFGWWGDPKNRRAGNVRRIDDETRAYLDEKSKELGVPFDDEQRIWYWQEKKELGLFMKRENPTVLEECWEVPIEGAIYGETIEKIRARGQITTVPYDPLRPVNTFWDLGSPENTVVWYVQENPDDTVDFIDVDGGLDLTTEDRVPHMKDKGYEFGGHYLPHDAAATQKGGQSYQKELELAGLENVHVIPRTTNLELGLNSTRKMLLRCRFDKKRCERGIAALSSYRAKVDEVTGFRTENIIHDWTSHFADACRMRSEAEEAGMLSNQGWARFDQSGLAKLNEKVLTIQTKRGEVSIMNHGTTWTEGAGGWLEVLKVPNRGKRYMIGYAVLGQTHAFLVGDIQPGEDFDGDRIQIVAAHADAEMCDPDVAAHRLKCLSTYYGTCPVVVVTAKKELEPTAKLLRERGVPQLWQRPRIASTGGGKSSAIPGFEVGPDMIQPMAELARMVREELLDVFVEGVRKEMRTFIVHPDGTEGPPPGYNETWVRALAALCHARSAAIQFAQPAASMFNGDRSRMDFMAAGLAPQPKRTTL